MDFDDVAKKIEDLRFDRNSKFFHGLVSDMLLYLGFKFKEKWYEADAVGKPEPIQFTKIEQAAASIVLYHITNFASRHKFERHSDFVVSTTNHSSLENFIFGIYKARSVMSNSTLGLKNDVMDAGDVKRMFDGALQDPLSMAFDKGYIVRLGDRYFLHPKLLYSICLEKKEKIT